MNTWIRRAVQVGVLSAGLVLAGAAAAQADDEVDMTSVGNLGILNGNQAYFPIQVPIDVCGNALGIVGNAQASCVGGASATIDGHGAHHGKPGKHHPGKHHKAAADRPADDPALVDVGVLTSNDLLTPPRLPLDLCGASGVTAGDAHASCGAGSGAGAGDTRSRTRKSAANLNDDVDMTSVGNLGIVNGNQLYFPIQLPIDVCGNGLGVLGNGQGACKGGAKAKIDRHTATRSPKRAPVARASRGDVDMTSVGNLGILNGNQLYFPIQVPIDVCGNGLGLVGNGQGACRGGSTATLKRNNEVDMTSSGNLGILNGNQAYFPIQIPVDLSGNGLGVLGNGQAASRGGATAVQ